MIKRKFIRNVTVFILMFCCIFIFQNTVSAAALKLSYDGKTVNYTGASYKITINNKQINTDFPGIDFNKKTMIPLRAVFEHVGGTVVWNSKTQIMDITFNGIKLQFKNNSANATIDGKSVKLSYMAKKINDRLIVPVDFLKNMKDISYAIDTKTKTININLPTEGSVGKISGVTSGGKDVITLIMNNHKGYKAARVTEPDRIVIDFENVKSSEEVQTVKTDLDYVTGINYYGIDSNITRVEINLKGMDNFTVDTISGGCKITVEKPINTDMSYVNNFDRVYFSLKGIKLANTSSTITKYFKDEYDSENKRYTIIIPWSSSISLADEDFNINDSLLDSVKIYRDEETRDTKIEFNAKKELKFYTTFNDKRNQTEINLLEPAKEDERLVVIDPGHGGQDPGATKNSVTEKELNLAIALKLEELLKKNNVRTYMMRQDDTFVGLYDRPFIANELNATLFLSIHNNSIDNSKVRGTETLYYPEKDGDTSFTGEKFAQLIQDTLIKKVDTVNRKTVERPGLVVLKYTKMPASLVEVGFLTNPTDLSNLQNKTFQQKTAEALCDAILKSLERIEAEKKEVSEKAAEDVSEKVPEEVPDDVIQE